ncbi:hypothetical protein L9F63_008970, partial [Diploptera punctata]
MENLLRAENPSSETRRKSISVEPYLRLQNKSTSWSSKSESDISTLDRGEVDRYRVKKLIADTPHFCAQRRNSLHVEPYTSTSMSVDVSNGYAVPFPIVKKRSASVVDYGNVAVSTESRKVSVSSEPPNICQCIGRQKFIEGHYKATYICDVTKEDISNPERASQNVPTPSARKSIQDEEKGRIYSNFMASNCVMHKFQVPGSSQDDENHYGNCTCMENVGKRSVRSRRVSKASSTSSVRSTCKRNRDAGIPKLSDLCVRILINS